MHNNDIKSLVSVGIPTYNRPLQLLQALKSVINQSYKNLEIIISDNSNNTSSFEKINTELKNNTNIKYYKQKNNIGAINNFKFVLEKSTGPYFMWVADDDILNPFFINECLAELINKGQRYAAVTMEAQYFSESEVFGFFEEGVFFNHTNIDNTFQRIKKTIEKNYGNLWYSLFRKNALINKNTSVFDCIKLNSFNEISFFIHIAAQGNFSVIPKIGYYKNTNLKTYMQAQWEIKGGDIPDYAQVLKNKLNIKKYHLNTITDIYSSINTLNLPKSELNEIKKYSAKHLFLHHKKMIESASNPRQKTKIFIGMPVHNGEKYIQKSIESILSQTYTNWKLFISDNKSTDKTFEICKKFAKKDKRITYVLQKNNIGAVNNFNYTLQSSDCHFFKWMAHDDILNHSFLEKCIYEFEIDKNLTMSFSNIVNIDSFDRIVREYPSFYSIIGETTTETVTNFLFSPEILGKANLIYSIFKTEFCKNVWKISPLTETWGSDMAFVLCALSRGKSKILKDNLFKKRICKPTDRIDCLNKIIIDNPQRHIFPISEYKNYTKSLLKATQNTYYSKLTHLIMKKKITRLYNEHTINFEVVNLHQK